jgi:RNA polymerase sigma-70 factor (ECF subfamily)
VAAALDRLPTDQREAVVLFYLEGYAVREIAGRAGASESAVKMRLKRARESLRDTLSPLFEGVEIT